LIKKNLKIPKG